MKIREVVSQADKRLFLEIPLRIYAGDVNWIRPLDKDINGIFDPKKNKYFRHGEIKRWIITDDDGRPAGRVAAFINRKTASSFAQPTGGMGFFECINDRDAAFLLFNT